jgi:hypothetical protein
VLASITASSHLTISVRFTRGVRGFAYDLPTLRFDTCYSTQPEYIILVPLPVCLDRRQAPVPARPVRWIDSQCVHSYVVATSLRYDTHTIDLSRGVFCSSSLNEIP